MGLIVLTMAFGAAAAQPDAVSGATEKRKSYGKPAAALKHVPEPHHTALSGVGNANPFIASRAADETQIDRLLLEQYGGLGIEPAETCSDAVFIRRIFLDLSGTIPTAEQARSFVETRSSAKRAEVIDYMLQSDGFTDYCTMLWCDRLRVKSEFPINLWPNAVQAYHRWIHTSVRDNKSYDRFVREILTANGSNFRVPQVNFFRAVQNSDPASLAHATALTFMGCRIDAWPAKRRNDLAVFFSDLRFNRTAEWKEEIVYADLFSMSTNRRPETLTLPDGTSVTVPLDQDARAVFCDWLMQPDNPWFARNAVNRIWHQLFGTGLIHEPDDIRPDNPPANEEVLRLLERELVESGYDLRHVYRIILNSAVYQRSSLPKSGTPEAERLFAHYPLRRIDAETFIDTVCRITGTTEQYWSVIPEPFSFMPVEGGSVTLADGSITSPFLEKFGRPPRDTGLASERNNEVTASQMLHLLNSSHIRQKLEGIPARAAFEQRFRRQHAPSNRFGNIEEIYYSLLSRPPTDEEVAVIRSYTQSAQAAGGQVGMDVVWALFNSPEFIFKH